jgi:hypothetical protein
MPRAVERYVEAQRKYAFDSMACDNEQSLLERLQAGGEVLFIRGTETQLKRNECDYTTKTESFRSNLLAWARERDVKLTTRSFKEADEEPERLWVQRDVSAPSNNGAGAE